MEGERGYFTLAKKANRAANRTQTEAPRANATSIRLSA
jgi:hypothetical protein